MEGLGQDGEAERHPGMRHAWSLPQSRPMLPRLPQVVNKDTGERMGPRGKEPTRYGELGLESWQCQDRKTHPYF